MKSRFGLNTKDVFSSFIKKIAPRWFRNKTHLFYAWFGALYYRHPSEQLFVIGITGTSGKSSTIHFLRQILEFAGFTVGSLSTVDFYVAGETKLNDKKMTMLGKMAIQKYLRKMVQKKCDVAIIETTSEGYVQYRHRFINYDAVLLTNLYPEHIESHGGFENYKGAKLGIFKHVLCSHNKAPQHLVGKKINEIFGSLVEKTSIVNTDHDFAIEFFKMPFSKRKIFGAGDGNIKFAYNVADNNTYRVKNLSAGKSGLNFEVQNISLQAPIYGQHNAVNIAGALAVAQILKIDLTTLQKAVAKITTAPGRIEFIEEAEKFGFKVIVDYAFEPGAMNALYQVVKMLKPNKVIHVFGSTGGGRDKARRYTVGELVGKNADICIITDEDPYDDNPQEIIDDVANAVVASGKKDGESVLKILDRKQAIEKAIQLASAGDIVLITGKGSEQRMVVRGVMVPWDDRQIAREAIASL